MENREQINAVQRMQTYLVEQGGKITLEALSQAAGYSPWQCIRIFKRLTGSTPFEYARALRLTDAAKRLRDTKERVLDIALDCGFDSHDGFTRAFAKQFDMTPRRYQQEKPPLPYFTYYPIQHYDVLTTERKVKPMEKKFSKTVTVQIVSRPARKLVMLRSQNATDYLSFCQEKGCEWDGFFSSISEKLDDCAICTLPAHLIKEGTSACVAGIEVPMDFAKELPGEYEIIDLPACDMAYFLGMPYAEQPSLFCEAIDTVLEAAANYDPAPFGYALAPERAPRFLFGTSETVGAKAALPVKRLK